MKVLLSAYSCEPGKGSEPGVGWNVVREVANYHDVWVLTRPDESGAAIEAELTRNPVPNLHFVYFTLPFWGNGWRWGLGGMQLHYYLWQIQAYFVAHRLHCEIGFDIIHHVTFGKYWGPSFLSLLPVPFIWGPVGGGESAPKAFWRDFSLRGKIYETLRDLACWLGEQDPFVHLTAQRSALAIVATSETFTRLRYLGAKRIEMVFGQTGINQQELIQLEKLAITSVNTPIRFLSMGRLLHWKGFNLGLCAFAQASLEKSEYWIIGDGPERKRLSALASELGIADRVRFWGSLPREEALRKLGECHVLVHPSLHDFSPTVCVEAMAAGLPVICLNLGGPAIQVTEETGIKVPAHTPNQAVRDLAEAMALFDKDPELRIRTGEAGQKRVREVYDWKAMGLLLTQIYTEILEPDKRLA